METDDWLIASIKTIKFKYGPLKKDTLLLYYIFYKMFENNFKLENVKIKREKQLILKINMQRNVYSCSRGHQKQKKIFVYYTYVTITI